MKKTPKYQQIANRLREEIQQNNKIGDRIMGEEELCDKFSVSRITIRQSLAILFDEGWLSRQQGRGTFVARESKSSNKSGIDRIALVSRFAPESGLILPYFSEILDGVKRECMANEIDLNVILFQPGDTEILQKVNQSRADAVIILNEVHIPALDSFNGHTVGLCHYDEVEFDCINNDDEGGALRGIKYLSSLGKKHIVVLCDPAINKAGMGHRLEGVRQAQLLYDVKIEDKDLVFGDYGKFRNPMDYAFRLMDDYLSQHKTLPDAFFALSDQYAIGCLSALQRHGISCPEQVSVLGYENIDMANYTNPALTTIKVDMDRLGRVGVRRLLQRASQPDLEATKLRIETDLVVRSSVS